MDYLEKFRSSSPRARALAISVAIVAIVATLAAFYLLVLKKDYAVLFTDLRAMDAATIVADLEKNKVPYRLDDKGTTILVPEDLVDRTRLNILNQDLPLKGTVGFELFNKSDMGLTEFAQKINYQRALQGELARTIMNMASVDTARVHLSLPESTVFRGDQKPPKASVTIVPRDGQQLTEATVLGIQRLVAAAVSDLVPASVVVLDERGQVISGATPEIAAAQTAPGALSPQMEQKGAIETYYAAKVRQAVQLRYPGIPVQANVWVELNPMGLQIDPGSLDRWSPGNREFPLRVTVYNLGEQSPEIVREIKSSAEQAVGFAPGMGDALLISAATISTELEASLLPPAPALPAAAPLPTSAPGPEPTLAIPVAVVGILLILLVTLAMIAQGRSRRPRSLTAQERGDYTHRLKILLEREEADAVPRH